MTDKTLFYIPKRDILGNNPTKVCELCRGSGEQKCTSSDPHANFDGALRCLDAGGDVAFVRHDTVATNRPGDLDVSDHASTTKKLLNLS